jgi:DNA-binding HxlR family transcriptional regulator
LVKREIPNTVPMGIKYILTNKGIDLVPILDSLCNWGKLYADGKEITVAADKRIFTVAKREANLVR